MASTTFDQAAADAMLKQLYDVPAMVDLSYSDRPFFALVNKRGGEGGNGVKIPLAIATSQGFSPTVALAVQYLAAQDLKAFLVTPITLLSVAQIAGITLESAMTDKESFAKGTKQVVDAAIKRLANGVSSGLFRDGTGAIGSFAPAAAAPGTGIITLTNPADVVQFEVNQALQASTADGLTLAGAVAWVISVNRTGATPTITVSTTLGGAAAFPASWTTATLGASAKLYSAGTYASPVTPSAYKQVSGLSAWLKDPALVTAVPFYGVDRSSDKTRLAGVYYDGATLSVKDAIINAINLVAREGGKPDYCFMNFDSYTQLAQDLQSNVIYTSLVGPGKISFSGFRFQGPRGEVIVVPDRDCEPNTAYLLQLDSWMLLHSNEGEAIFLDDNGVGQVFRTLENEDARQVRVKFYGNLACNAPGYNAKVKLSA